MVSMIFIVERLITLNHVKKIFVLGNIQVEPLIHPVNNFYNLDSSYNILTLFYALKQSNWQRFNDLTSMTIISKLVLFNL